MTAIVKERDYNDGLLVAAWDYQRICTNH
jgi:hypothetical protein